MWGNGNVGYLIWQSCCSVTWINHAWCSGLGTSKVSAGFELWTWAQIRGIRSFKRCDTYMRSWELVVGVFACFDSFCGKKIKKQMMRSNWSLTVQTLCTFPPCLETKGWGRRSKIRALPSWLVPPTIRPSVVMVNLKLYLKIVLKEGGWSDAGLNFFKNMPVMSSNKICAYTHTQHSLPLESPSSQNNSPSALLLSSKAMISPMGLRRLEP